MSRRGCILSGVSGTPIRLSAEPQALEPTRAERIAELRSRMADMGAHAPQRVLPDADVLGVGDQFHRVLPDGGVPRRAVTHILSLIHISEPTRRS